MAWSSPRTWTTGEIVTAAMMNSDVRDNMLYQGGTTGNLKTGQQLVQADATTSGGQIIIEGAANANKQLLLLFDTTNNIASIQATEQGVSTRALQLNPSGGAVSANGVPFPLTTAAANLGADGTLTVGSDQDLVSVSLAAGTWEVNAWGSFLVAAGAAANIDFFIWDGTTYHASGNSYQAANLPISVALGPTHITLGSTTSVRFGCRPSAATTSKFTSFVGGRANATGIRARRIG